MSLPKTCQIADCDNPHRARGYCGTHYMQAHREGKLTLTPRRSPSADLRQVLLAQSVVAEDGSGCRRWQGMKSDKGYGRISVAGRKRQVHAVAYELWIGAIPEGNEIDHVAARGCRHRDCIEPSHLEAVTRLENNRRVPRASHCPSGHPMSGANLYIHIRRGYPERICRACRYERKARWRAQKRRATPNA